MSTTAPLSAAVYLACVAARLPVSEFFASQIVQALDEAGFEVVEKVEPDDKIDCRECDDLDYPVERRHGPLCSKGSLGTPEVAP